MKLSLSTAATTDLALDALDEACRGRGLDGIEVVLEAGDDASTIAARVRASGARVVALHAEIVDERVASGLARASAELGVPVSVAPFGVAHTLLSPLARVFAAEGGRLLVGCRTNVDEVFATSRALDEAGPPSSIGFAWEVRPNSDALERHGPVLRALRHRLGLVRLFGGGPEQREQDGRGIGPLFVDLALAGFAGPVVLTPSREGERPRWREWLSSRTIAGCGTAHARREARDGIDLRAVEPKDRLPTIVAAYRSLESGSTLRLTLDHDPSCMQYGLEATEPEGSFTIKKIGNGPLVWHAEVTKH